MKRVFIVHGWDGYPHEGWFPWLKKNLQERGFKVVVPRMPNPDKPEIKTWVNTLKKLVGEPNQSTYFVGHSVGCQAILHYLETLNENNRVGGAVFVGGWLLLKPAAVPGRKEKSIYREWRRKTNNIKKIKVATKNFAAIFSDNDPYVYLEKNSRFFKEKLKAKIIVEHNKKHFSGEDGIKKLPSALKAVLEISSKK